MLRECLKQNRTPSRPVPNPLLNSLEQGGEGRLRETTSIAEQVRQLWEKHHGRASVSGKNRGIIRKLIVAYPVMAFWEWLVKRVRTGKPIAYLAGRPNEHTISLVEEAWPEWLGEFDRARR